MKISFHNLYTGDTAVQGIEKQKKKKKTGDTLYFTTETRYVKSTRLSRLRTNFIVSPVEELCSPENFRRGITGEGGGGFETKTIVNNSSFSLNAF